MKTIDIHGGNGQHASDLHKRGIFNGFTNNTIDRNSNFENKFETSGIIVPISKTKQLITSIMQTSSEIINFSGIMSTTPEHIRNKDKVSNFHFLFGPKADNNLKVAFAGKFSEAVDQIMENTTNAGITIIETDIEKHDEIVSIIQALTHFIIFLSGLTKNNKLTHEWNTPDLTISDMILENPLFIQKLNKIINQIKFGDNLSELFLNHVNNLTQIEINNFGTPTFNRVLNFCKSHDIIVNKSITQILSAVKDKNILLQSIIAIKQASKTIVK